jgi:hypothetical protein
MQKDRKRICEYNNQDIFKTVHTIGTYHNNGKCMNKYEIIKYLNWKVRSWQKLNLHPTA